MASGELIINGVAYIDIQLAALATLVGDGDLDTTATNLTDAVNEVLAAIPS